MTLLQRLEQAAEGSRELDDEVLMACGWKYTETAVRHTPRFISPDGKVFEYRDRPSPTTSLDAALTLYKTKPNMVSTNPIVVCLEALDIRARSSDR